MDRASRLCGLLRMDDLNFSVWKDADDGHLPLMYDLELPVLLIVLGEQMLSALRMSMVLVLFIRIPPVTNFEAVLLL